MKHTSKIIGTETEFLEGPCCIVLQGRKFCNDGSYMLQEAGTGRRRALLYAFQEAGQVGTWDGSKKVRAHFGHSWRSNFGDLRQSVYFKWSGVEFYGVYFKENSDIIRAREVEG